MRTRIPYWILVILAVAAFLMTSLAGQPQAPAHEGAGTASQGQAKTSTKTSPSAGGRKIPCKTPENASICYRTHGRLAIANGNPPFRIWKIGTRRMLAVFSGPSHFPPRSERDTDFPEFPESLDKAYDAYNRRMKREVGSIGAIPPPAFADFEVCPLEEEKAGEMRAVCIESAENIVIPRDY